MKKITGVLCIVVMVALPIQVFAKGAFTLVADGKVSCMIVISPDLTDKMSPEGNRPLKQNIVDFQRILEKMSGAKIPIVTSDKVKSKGRKIYVGNVPLPRGIKIDETKISSRGYCIIATKNALVLRGKTEGGTINSLYGFLQDKLGVRWFFPSELFEVVPDKKTVSVLCCNEIHNPSFNYPLFTLDHGVPLQWIERMRRDEGAHKLRADIHFLGYILDSAKYGKTHPEFYPLMNGQRVIPPPGRADSAPQPCLSNPGLVKAVVEFCRNSFDKNPDNLSVSIGVNDSMEWCECAKCKAMDVLPLEEKFGAVQHPDRYFTFANQVAKEIAKTHPGKIVGCLAYNAGTVLPPKNIKQLEPNIAIALCLDTSQYYDKNFQRQDDNLIAAWKKKCKNIAIYDYIGLGWSTPRYYPHLAAANLKKQYKQNVIGLYSELHPHWATFGPMVYLTSQLKWDINQDPDVLLDELFTKLFGTDAGREMKAYYEVFENAWMRPNPGRTGKWFEGWSSMREQIAIYKLSDLDEALAHLAKAKKLAKNDFARKRIDYIAHNFSYTATLLRGWLTSDVIDDELNKGGISSPEKAGKFRNMLLQVSQALRDEEPVYKKTLLIDPISAKGYYKAGHTGHFGIIRGAWAPRCKYSLTNGTAQLLKYYKKNDMAEEISFIKRQLPAEIIAAAEEMSAETLGKQLVQNGEMEKGNPPTNWQLNDAKLSRNTDCHSNKQSLKISASKDLGGASQTFAVKPNTKYKLEFWYKCSRPGGLYVSVNAGQKKNAFGEIKYDDKWTKLTAYFTTPQTPSTTKATISFCSWPGKDTLIDTVSIREIRPPNLMDCKKVDGNFPDWENPTFTLDSSDKLGKNGSIVSWRGPDKFSSAACLGWQDEGIRLVVKVKDDDYNQSYKEGEIWRGDSIQFGIDAGADGARKGFGSGYDDVNDFVYGLALRDRTGSTPELYRWNAPKGKPVKRITNDGKKHTYSVKVANGVFLYDILISWDELGLTLKIGNAFGFNLVVFDRYKLMGGVPKLMFMQLTPGIAGEQGQSPALWRKFVLEQ
jgi:hypothetical protein